MKQRSQRIDINGLNIINGILTLDIIYLLFLSLSWRQEFILDLLDPILIKHLWVLLKGSFWEEMV